MSNGDSLDGFVFPPFIPAAAARPADPPAPAAQPPVASDEPPAAPQTASGRMTMPWDVETPIVSEPADGRRQAAAAPQPATDEAEDEDLPWLERPEPREPVAEAPATEAAAPAEGEAFPEWLAWDDRANEDARSEAGALPALEGLQDFAPVDDLGGFIAPEPAVEWAEAAPPAELEDSSGWSLHAPEAAEPPVVADAAPEVTFDTSAAAAEPAFDVTLDDGALTFAAAESTDAVAAAGSESTEAEAAADEPLFDPASSAYGGYDPPSAFAEPQAEDAEPVTTHPFVADAEAVLSAEADPFTAAAASQAAAAAPGEMGIGISMDQVFHEVAGRLEDIARTLRERPDQLVAGAISDPLALLVAGYVMGYGARR